MPPVLTGGDGKEGEGRPGKDETRVDDVVAGREEAGDTGRWRAALLSWKAEPSCRAPRLRPALSLNPHSGSATSAFSCLGGGGCQSVW